MLEVNIKPDKNDELRFQHIFTNNKLMQKISHFLEGINKNQEKIIDLLELLPAIVEAKAKKERAILTEIKKEKQKFLGTPIEKLDLSNRTYKCLVYSNSLRDKTGNKIYIIRNIGDLLDYTPFQIRQIPNFGAKCLRELKGLLAIYNLKFKDDV